MRSFALLFAAVFACSLHAAPAQAQAQRVFVSATGSDGNSCSFASPCRTFQHAHDVAPANGEIDVLDPAGYGSLTITKAISIQGHGFSGISAANSATAITINAGASDSVSLRGLLIDGAGTGSAGIQYNTAANVAIADCVVRNFVNNGIWIFSPGNAVFTVSNTTVSDNGFGGIVVQPQGAVSNWDVKGLVSNVTASNNQYGIYGYANDSGNTGRIFVTVSDSVIFHNTHAGIEAQTVSKVGTVSLIVDNTTITGAAVAFFCAEPPDLSTAIGIVADGSLARVLMKHSLIAQTGEAVVANTSGAMFTTSDNEINYDNNCNNAPVPTPLPTY
jgi:hypothetical protein